MMVPAVASRITTLGEVKMRFTFSAQPVSALACPEKTHTVPGTLERHISEIVHPPRQLCHSITRLNFFTQGPLWDRRGNSPARLVAATRHGGLFNELLEAKVMTTTMACYGARPTKAKSTKK